MFSGRVTTMGSASAVRALSRARRETPGVAAEGLAEARRFREGSRRSRCSGIG